MCQPFKLLEERLPIINLTQKVDVKLLDLLKGEFLSALTTRPGSPCGSKICQESGPSSMKRREQNLRQRKARNQYGSWSRQPGSKDPLLVLIPGNQVEGPFVVLLPTNGGSDRGQKVKTTAIIVVEKKDNSLSMCLSTWILSRLPFGLNSRDRAAGGICFGHSTFEFDFRILASVSILVLQLPRIRCPAQ